MSTWKVRAVEGSEGDPGPLAAKWQPSSQKEDGHGNIALGHPIGMETVPCPQASPTEPEYQGDYLGVSVETEIGT